MTSFNFMQESKDDKNESTIEKEIATSGSPLVGSITPEIKAEAKRLAGSPKGLDIDAFQRKYKIHIMNVDEVLKD